MSWAAGRRRGRARAVALFSCLVLTLAVGCAPPFRATPHERYARSLRAAGLDETALGRDWLIAADRAIAEPLPSTLPLQEVVEVSDSRVWARGYRLALRRGQRLRVSVLLSAEDTTQVFADLYRADTTHSRSIRVASAVSSPPALEHEARQDGEFVLRLQCELLRATRFTIEVESGPSLAFPVHGRDSRAVISFFGDARGSRDHQGIDIRAPRGTPAISPIDGVVTSAGSNRLGGKVVWLLDPERKVVLYYAHLDRHHTRPGERVEPGDTLGFVGNTGNAEGTVPHLHFGIYAAGEGAIDPYPFVAR